MPTAEARQHRSEVDRKLTRLRYQFLFLFFFGMFVTLVIFYLLQQQANRIEYERYDLCVARAADIGLYNSSTEPPGKFPLPRCGADPRG